MARMEDALEKFNELVRLYDRTRTAMSAICVAKGGIDMDNYPGRFFAADLLEFAAAYGAKAGADTSKLRAELEKIKDDVTPASKPMHEMTLAEFERMIGEV
jgi:hypothetical protein